MIGYKTRATFSTNGNPNQNQSCFGRTRFPALGTCYMYLLRVLIGSLYCLHLLRLARAITLVLVLRHSIGNLSIILGSIICILSASGTTFIVCLCILTDDFQFFHQIFIFFGTYAYQPSWLDFAFRGAPLGEMVQWSDLLASLYMLGHDLTLAVNATTYKR